MDLDGMEWNGMEYGRGIDKESNRLRGKEADVKRRSDRQTGKQTDRQKDRLTGRQTDRQIDRQIDKQIDR